MPRLLIHLTSDNRLKSYSDYIIFYMWMWGNYYSVRMNMLVKIPLYSGKRGFVIFFIYILFFIFPALLKDTLGSFFSVFS